MNAPESRNLLMTFEVTPTSHLLADYRARGGYAAVEKALTTMTPKEITEQVTASGIQGRGGANFSAGRKWGVINLTDGQPHYLCANADEGEPGTFKDRWILENAPHLLLESMLIAAYALQVGHAFIYIRGEFDLPYRRIAGALDEAYAAGFYGKPLFGTDFACDLIVYRGAGSYVCGEASGLLSSLEGKRGYPRNRPPRLTVRGLNQRPTVVNNVETLSNIAGIITHGAEAFKTFGTKKSPGTRLVSISGHIVKPGVYEVEPGRPFREFIFDTCGGVPHGRKVKAIIPGGVSTKVVTGDEVDRVRLDNEDLATVGSGMGSGGMVVIAEGTCMVRLLQVLLRFYHHESEWLDDANTTRACSRRAASYRIVAGEGRPEDIEQLKRISAWNDGNTICGMGDAAGYAALGILAKFGDEFEHYIAHKRSRHDGNLECRAST